MERMFVTHRVRSSRETLPLWTMTTLDPGGLPSPVKVMVPGVWESLPALKRYRGRAVFEQEVACGGHVRFWFGGVSFRARVWLDEQEIGAHYGAYTGFEAIVRDLPQGRHTLRVEADNRYGEDSALHVPNDYYAYGGINRPVLIEQLGAAMICSAHVTPRLEEGVWHAQVDVRLRELSCVDAVYQLRIEVAGDAVEKQLSFTEGGECTVRVDLPCLEARAWSPESPVLTELRVTLLAYGKPVDDLIDRFGFREVRVEGKRLLLNGQPLRLKGFNRHEDFNDFGVCVPAEAMLRDLQLLRDLGANCVRTCHYPNDPRFLDLCDELGILVWEEAHARGLSEKQMRNPAFMPQQEQCVREMVDQHMNHPSIFIWGCLNECEDTTSYGAECFRSVFRLLKQLDPSRPTTAALLERSGSLVGDDSDVVSINIYPQWYHDTPVEEAYARKLGETGAVRGDGKPVIVSEIGAGAIPGYHDPFGQAKWSEERQCAILRSQLEAVLGNPDCSGVFLWQLADVRVDESWFAKRPRCMNNKGVVDEYRRPKLAYQTVKELFHSL
ncbi:MAG: glycoside hydrolase family 2 protein [Aristaeellaceae bacterium]